MMSTEKTNEKHTKVTRTKTIKAPGSKVERIAQACDRCRLKKIKCDGKRPRCSQCELVGFECKVSDKLSRLSYPRGYTETLEQRVRELEAENKKLLNLLDLKNDNKNGNNSNNNIDYDRKTIESNKRLSSTNLSLLNQQQESIHNNSHPSTSLTEHIDGFKHIHTGPGCCVNYPHSIHETPVSIAGSVDLEQSDDQDSLYSFHDSTNSIFDSSSNFNNNDNFNNNFNSRTSTNINNNGYQFNNISFEQNQAPGLNAALALARVNNSINTAGTNGGLNYNTNPKVQLANLVAMSIPRSTEETLFIPSLLSKIGEIYGLNSKVCYFTANTIASLKQIPKKNNLQKNYNDEFNEFDFHNLNFKNLSMSNSNLFFNHLKIPSKIQLDQLITIYFQEWGMVLPIIDKNEFSKEYLNFLKSLENKFTDNLMYQKERFGCLMILIIQLSLISLQKSNSISQIDEQLITYYDYLIHELIQSSLTQPCCIQSLQILALAFFYCINIGDVITSYQLRGRVITMAQQLRLHRCPTAVLGINGSTVSKFQQGERRILFWCIYTLDSFSSLQLGVPRLLKDYEIECALPLGVDSDETDENFVNNNFIMVNNSTISLVGKVSKFSLSIMRYSQVLGNILDSIFKRHSSIVKNSDSSNVKNANYDLILIHENLLDSWRRALPTPYKFDIDVNGSFKLDNSQENDKILDFKQIILISLYYSSKMLIHLPIIASEVEKSSRSSNIVIQQCALAILKLFDEFKDHIPLPMNINRLKTRLILLSAKGSLEYTRGGALFQDCKRLLTELISELKLENWDKDLPGSLSNSCLQLLEHSIDLILGGSNKSTYLAKESSVPKRTNSINIPFQDTNCNENNSNTGDNYTKPSSPLSNRTSIVSSKKRTINYINNMDQPTLTKKNDLSEMLSQINSIPPITIKPEFQNDRIPQVIQRKRSTSLSTPSSSLENNDTFNINTDNFDFNLNEFNVNGMNGDENYEFADFGADGSLGLEPWLNVQETETNSNHNINNISTCSNNRSTNRNSDKNYELGPSKQPTGFDFISSNFNHIGSNINCTNCEDNRYSVSNSGDKNISENSQSDGNDSSDYGENGMTSFNDINGINNSQRSRNQSLFDWQNSH
ncbi:hypothetical protein WICMUC_003228 [Wickerhamomyces mucosus]|uniref:Zn(2)-C6 fungal-type domain-containing protein n=1 Tax=Wickerhamomyces mucosus TaxID=1378264 RepID=A0A9P8TCY1_9ASCO|nr:hypothetical protein WICMUC_003228 [Wickerhamomyces mucosus]